MVLQNYIKLTPGVPARMHFTDHTIPVKEIRDPDTGRIKDLNTLVFEVDELDSRPVHSTYSITSDKHALDFAPYLADKSYRNFTFEVTQIGDRYTRTFKVMPTRR